MFTPFSLKKIRFFLDNNRETCKNVDLASDLLFNWRKLVDCLPHLQVCK
jgi:hypothetical protein